jgi:predicted nucleic acid-binding protein
MTTWLVDKSALARIGMSPDAAEWTIRAERGLLAISTVTRLELGYSARSGAELQHQLASPPMSVLVLDYLTPAIESRAIQVQTILAERGLHRAPSIPDLLVAAAAEIGKRTVLHVDKDFELIAEVTGQPVERLRLQ